MGKNEEGRDMSKELKEWNSCSSGEDFNSLQINKALTTAKRLGAIP